MRWQWPAAALVGVAVATGLFIGAAPALSWLADVPAATGPARVAADPLPMVRTADTLLDRARELYAGGHLRDALRLLDRVGIADPVRPDAERLRADIQRDLLASVTDATASPAAAETPQ